MPLPNGMNCAGSPPSVAGGKLKISNVPIGPTALASIGTNTTDAVNYFMTDIWIPVNRFITKVGVLQGGTAGTDSILAAIYTSAGVLIGSSALAGTALNSSANTFLELTLTLDGAGVAVPGIQLYGPAQYYIGIQGNGTAAGAIQTIKTATYIDVCANTVTATPFGTLPATVTVPVAFVADKGPVVYVY